jgi:hypothetical protein
LEPAVSWSWSLSTPAERPGVVQPLPSDEDFHADPVVRLAAELMDPLHGVPIPPRWSATELRALAESKAKP